MTGIHTKNEFRLAVIPYGKKTSFFNTVPVNLIILKKVFQYKHSQMFG